MKKKKAVFKKGTVADVGITICVLQKVSKKYECCVM